MGDAGNVRSVRKALRVVAHLQMRVYKGGSFYPVCAIKRGGPSWTSICTPIM
jgi:hypothetical protein